MSGKTQHDQIRVQTIETVPCPRVVSVQSSLMSDILHNFVLTLARCLMPTQVDLLEVEITAHDVFYSIMTS